MYTFETNLLLEMYNVYIAMTYKIFHQEKIASAKI